MYRDNYEENLIYKEPFDWEMFWWDRINEVPTLIGLIIVIGSIWYMFKYYLKKDK